MKVFDAEGADATQGQRPLTSAGIVAGIDAVIAAYPEQHFDVVNISLAVRQSDPALEAAVARLVKLDLVVVAASGNREEDPEHRRLHLLGDPGQRRRRLSRPTIPGVVAVSATPPGDEDPSTYVLPNLDTDVAAPTAGAISTNATGQVCVVGEIATSWAAAEVSGIVALLRERYPRETPQQLVARLQATTEGAGAPEGPDGVVENPWTGAGVVQAATRSPARSSPGARARSRRPWPRPAPTRRPRRRRSGSTSSAPRARSCCGRASSPARCSRSPSCCVRCCDADSRARPSRGGISSMTDTSDEPVAVILAGGQGSRLWPISRDRRPKQFQPVVRDRPLLTGTIERLSELVDPSRIHVSTRARFADAARATLGPVPPENLILEEDPAGPATAFGLSIATLAHKYGNAPALIAPSDHLINEEEAFNAASRDMLDQLAETPTRWWCSGPSPRASTRAWATSTPRVRAARSR